MTINDLMIAMANKELAKINADPQNETFVKARESANYVLKGIAPEQEFTNEQFVTLTTIAMAFSMFEGQID